MSSILAVLAVIAGAWVAVNAVAAVVGLVLAWRRRPR